MKLRSNILNTNKKYITTADIVFEVSFIYHIISYLPLLKVLYCLLYTLLIFLNLHIAVPAYIIDDLSSDDMTLQEGDTAIFVCNVTGVPPPEVTWYRRHTSSQINQRERKTVCM